MAKIKIERMLNLGAAYTPEMGAGGKPEPSWVTLGEQVREAGSLGYDTVLAVEVQHDPYLILAVAAQEPSTIELGTGIALAFTKSPVATAYTAWDLQRMSGGRLVLGLGSQVKGHITRRFGMPFTKPAQRMKDYVGAMRACWKTWQAGQTGAPLDFQSEHYNLSLMTPNFAPPPLKHPHIPVLSPRCRSTCCRSRAKYATASACTASARAVTWTKSRFRICARVSRNRAVGRRVGQLPDRRRRFPLRRAEHRCARERGREAESDDRVLRLDAIVPCELRARGMGRPGRAAAPAFGAAKVERDAQAGKRGNGARFRRGRHLARYRGGDEETLRGREPVGL